MIKFYGTKILNREINLKTGLIWQVEDVPSYWRNGVREWLQNNS